MTRALVLAIAAYSMTATAFAQAPDTDTSPGPHDPNPPMESPDLRLPSPCTPTPNLAAASTTAKPGMTTLPSAPPDGQILAATTNGDTQCSATGVTQSAELPGLAPTPQ